MISHRLRSTNGRILIGAAAVLAVAAVPAIARQTSGTDDSDARIKRATALLDQMAKLIDGIHKPSAAAAIPAVKGLHVLYGGTAADLAANWTQGAGKEPVWTVLPDGSLEVKPGSGDIGTKMKYTDFQMHLEFKVPSMPEAKGQGRGNSGLFLQGRYEIQLLDSYGFEKPGTGDCGAVYNKSAPLVNACKPPLQWQTYDIAFRGARTDDAGKVLEPARVSVIQNGVTVQNNTVINGVCGAAEDEKVGTPGRLRLQDHGNRMQFRNIWILPLPTESSKEYGPH